MQRGSTNPQKSSRFESGKSRRNLERGRNRSKGGAEKAFGGRRGNVSAVESKWDEAAQTGSSLQEAARTRWQLKRRIAVGPTRKFSSFSVLHLVDL